MKIHLIAFTQKGYALENKIKEYLIANGHEVLAYQGAGKDKKSLDAYAREGFSADEQGADGLLYIGATGIAVRSIAPYVKSKLSDPAILVVDDCGRFVIPLLSGHIGGANALADEIADFLGSISVVTTATDNNHVFAVDTWAKKTGLKIVNPDKIKKVSAKLLSGEMIKIATDYDVIGELPEGISIVTSEEQGDVLITTSARLLESRIDCLQLVPKVHTIGVGCRINTACEKMKSFVEDILAQYEISSHSVCKIASIDIKKQEEAICELARSFAIPYHTYHADELNAIEGTFTESEFVKRTVGTDNVCERSAIAGTPLQDGKLLVKKVQREGKTLAIARMDYIVRF